MNKAKEVKCGVCKGVVDTDEIELEEELFCASCSKPFPCMTHAETAHPDVDYQSEKNVGVYCPRCDKTFCVDCCSRCDKCPPVHMDDSWDFCWDCAQKHGCSNSLFLAVMGDKAEANKDGWPPSPDRIRKTRKEVKAN